MTEEQDRMCRLEESWAITRQHLSRAQNLLPQVTDASHSDDLFDWYQHFLDHNELELALVVLDATGDRMQASAAFWSELEKAADNMGLEHRAECYRAGHSAGPL